MPHIEALIVDTSQSMAAHGLFRGVQEQLTEYIEQQPPCVLVILSAFGSTADVVDARFLVTPSDRDHMRTAVLRLEAKQPHTNFDEAIKHIEWLVSKLQAAYGQDGFTMRVAALSDDEPSPGPEKPRDAPSLREWLAEHFPGGAMNATVMRVTPEQSSDDSAAGASGAIPVDEISERLQRGPAVTADIPSGNTNPVQSGSRSSGANTVFATKDKVSRIITANPRSFTVACLALSGVLLLLYFWYSIRPDPALLPPTDHGQYAEWPHTVPSAFRVQVAEFDDEKTFDAEKVTAEREIPAAVNVASIFGSDQLTAAFLVETQEIEPELFRITPRANGSVVVQSKTPGVSCNGELVSEAGIALDLRDPFAVRLANREWRIEPVLNGNESDLVHELFEVKAR